MAEPGLWIAHPQDLKNNGVVIDGVVIGSGHAGTEHLELLGQPPRAGLDLLRTGDGALEFALVLLPAGLPRPRQVLRYLTRFFEGTELLELLGQPLRAGLGLLRAGDGAFEFALVLLLAGLPHPRQVVDLHLTRLFRTAQAGRPATNDGRERLAVSAENVGVGSQGFPHGFSRRRGEKLAERRNWQPGLQESIEQPLPVPFRVHSIPPLLTIALFCQREL